MHEDPLHEPKFITMLLSYRMGKLEEELRKADLAARRIPR